MRTVCVLAYVVHMETETAAPAFAWDPHRFDAWCGSCQRVTESDDTTCKWCLECGERRSTNE